MQKSDSWDIGRNCATPSGSAGSCVPCPGGIAALNPRLLSAIPAGWEVCDPFGVGGFLCAVSRGYRCAQPPATLCHPCRDGGCATPSGSAGSCVPCPGGIAALNPRLLSAIPAGWGSATRKGCQTVAGGRSNAETSGQRLNPKT